jgi:hypothetical protein
MNRNRKISSSSNLTAEINHLHNEVQRLTTESRRSLNGALAAAMQAGQLLLKQKQTIGRGSWVTWIRTNFHGSQVSAYRYMALARETKDPGMVKDLSLRQAYVRLGIATEPKNPSCTTTASPIPEPIILAQKLTRILRHRKAVKPSYLEDLEVLFHQLERLFPATDHPLHTFEAKTQLREK